MGKPIFILAGQSNARRISGEVKDALNARYGEDGYVLVETYVAGAPLTWASSGRSDWASADQLPAALIADVQQAIEAEPNGYSGGLIWVQGEADTYERANPDQYRATVAALFDRIATELAAGSEPAAATFSKMKVVLSQLADLAPEGVNRMFWDDVIAAQKKTARTSDTITSVDPDDLAAAFDVSVAEMFADPLHYSGMFSRILADRLVERVADWSEASNGSDPINQANEPVRLRGSSVSEEIFGTLNDDVIIGNGGADLLMGAAGADRITGGADEDAISGGGGRDALFGLAGADVLLGDEGDDWIYGGRDNDRLSGGSGDDKLRGNLGNDILQGDDGRDDLRGGGGYDELQGGRGGDFLLGEKGSDRLDGGAGNDVMIGGVGAGQGDGVQDVFVYRDTQNEGGGFDRIRDWEDGIDLIDLSAFKFSAFEDVQALLETANQASDLRLNFGGGDVLYIHDLHINNFGADDVIL